MKNFMQATLLLAAAWIIFPGCDHGLPLPRGGELPTNYIIVKDSTFTPASLTVVSGSSITFVNNTATAHTLVSDDSLPLRPVTIQPGTSYFYKKDTSGTFYYHCVQHPVARGVFIVTP